MKKSVLWLSLLLLFLAGIGLKLYIVYFGYLNYRYLVPPGYDAIPHLGIINNLGATNWGYPKIFHYIVYYLSNLAHRDPFYVLTYWTPTLVILPSLALFFLLKQIFDLKTAWIAVLFFLFTSNYPLYGFVDGNYPNILGYGFFAIFCLAFAVKYLKTKKGLHLYLAAFFYILTGLTHHFSFTELSGILLLSLVTLIVSGQVKLSNFRLNFRQRSTVLLSLGLLLFLLVIYRTYGSLLISFIVGLVSNSPAVRDTYLNQAVPFNRYPEIVGPVIWYGGMFGFFYALATFLRSDKKDYTKIMCFVWLILIYTLSRLPASGLPERFARELAVPLMVFFAYLISRLVNHTDGAGQNRRFQFLGYAFIAYLIIINSSLSNTVLVDSLPNSFSKMVWFNQPDQFKSDYLKNNFAPDQKIYINPFANPYVKLMTKANLVDFSLDSESIAAYRIKKSPQKQDVIFYHNLIKDLARGNRGNIFYIFPKPASNPDSAVYPIFSQYDIYNDIMRDIANNQQVIKKFTDGSIIVKIEK